MQANIISIIYFDFVSQKAIRYLLLKAIVHKAICHKPSPMKGHVKASDKTTYTYHYSGTNCLQLFTLIQQYDINGSFDYHQN